MVPIPSTAIKNTLMYSYAWLSNDIKMEMKNTETCLQRRWKILPIIFIAISLEPRRVDKVDAQ